MTNLEAIQIIESEENPTMEEVLVAWSHLIKNRVAFSLQGFYGREASRLIESGLISKDGAINWVHIDW